MKQLTETHLAEFHQIKGLVCDRGLTLCNLMEVLQDFFSRLGMTKLKFKPAYNPFTEPSMEIFSYHECFKNVCVIAWGLSLERPTMIMYRIDNIRDLLGHKVDLGLIKKNLICHLGIE
ncbi:Phenylalanine--tRNA ligase alpha subunit [Quillaja saponaria]|uniref:Phenylalanine--tRNA ligase alpha subunit n=1 Tax=Quillaja saponaria TaxID=32244 RepID=A0AAD7PG78_QUISA|nr:Phenylalanine--tRNA ligase alpha subunit [Quillaja saponaria]